MLTINNRNTDEDNAAYVRECMAQRERLNVAVKDADALTADELEQILDYEDAMEDAEWIRRGC